MMIVSTSITIPASILANAPVRQEIKLAKGTLTKITFDVPTGPKGEVYLRVLHLENSILPDVTNQWIPVSGGFYSFVPLFNDWKNVYQLQLEGCSPQARYPHTIEVLFEVSEKGTIVEALQSFLRMGR